jgi:hypothetical protein
MSTETLLETMFAVHGKRSMEAQFNEYLKIFDQLGVEKSQKVFEHVRDNEERFPTIKQLWGIINSLGLINRSQSQLKSYDDCYYCGGVGYIPYLLSPKRDKRVTSYNTEVYACKCSAGQDVPKNVNRYFNTFKTVQFNEVMDGYNYPQMVTHKQREYQSKLNEDRNNGETKQRRNYRYTNTLEENELRKELEKITNRDTET